MFVLIHIFQIHIQDIVKNVLMDVYIAQLQRIIAMVNLLYSSYKYFSMKDEWKKIYSYYLVIKIFYNKNYYILYNIYKIAKVFNKIL